MEIYPEAHDFGRVAPEWFHFRANFIPHVEAGGRLWDKKQGSLGDQSWQPAQGRMLLRCGKIGQGQKKCSNHPVTAVKQSLVQDYFKQAQHS